jgi:hypothetical protein
LREFPDEGGITMKILVLTPAVFFTVLGVLSLLGRGDGYTDALFEPDYTIPWIPPGGPLANAGFQPGDSVVSVEGIPVEELGMYSRWPRSLARAPGETLTMTVERDGEMVAGEVLFGEVPIGIRRMRLGGLLVLLSFVWSGAWALLSVPSPHSGRLAALGVAAGLSIPPPNMGSWAGIFDHINVAAEGLLLVLLLRFFLFFPREKEMARGRFTTVALLAPWVVLLGCLVVELVFHPRYYHSFGGYIGILMLTYFLLALAALGHSWWKTPGKELMSSGLGFILAGLGIGLAGILLWAVDAFFLPTIHVPGSSWAPVLFGLLPVGMAMGILRANRS